MSLDTDGGMEVGSHDLGVGEGEAASPALGTPSPVPGKSPLLRPVQRRASGAASTAGVHAAAEAGLAQPAERLPHFAEIQRSFGGVFDLSGVQAHVGGAAAQASGAMGANAYATGGHVAFAKQPDLHTAAHEAAHVVQQSGGVHLSGGVGQAGDSYEQHADAVADRVVAGRSAADSVPVDTAGGCAAVGPAPGRAAG